MAKQEAYWSSEFACDVRNSCCVINVFSGSSESLYCQNTSELRSPLQFSQKNREVQQETTKTTGRMRGGVNGNFLIISGFPPLV